MEPEEEEDELAGGHQRSGQPSGPQQGTAGRDQQAGAEQGSEVGARALGEGAPASRVTQVAAAAIRETAVDSGHLNRSLMCGSPGDGVLAVGAGAASAQAQLLPHGGDRVLRRGRDSAPPVGSEPPDTVDLVARAAVPRGHVERRRPSRSSPSAASGSTSVGRASATAPRTPTSRPVCPPSLQPLDVDVRVRGLRDHGERLQQRPGLGQERPVLVPLRGCRRPPAVTRRTLKPRWIRWTPIEAANETACSSEEPAPAPAVGDLPVVQEERGARLPGLLLAPHHQLARVRAAAPVHPAQVVAAAVLADGDVLGAAAGERTRPVVAGPRPGARERDRR